MGSFTWTFANKPVKILDCGEISHSCKLPYGGYGAVLCPDNTLIKESDYEGYGIFNGKDVFELVVDWNRAHLREIVEKRILEDIERRFHHYMSPELTDYKKKFHRIYAGLACSYENGDLNACQKIADDFADKMQMQHFRKNWKRSLGIFINDGEKSDIPYPIKIISLRRRHKPYDAYPPSITCQ